MNWVGYAKFCNNDDQYPSYAYNLDCAVSQSSRGRDSSGFHYCKLPILTHYVSPMLNQWFNIGTSGSIKETFSFYHSMRHYAEGTNTSVFCNSFERQRQGDN